MNSKQNLLDNEHVMDGLSLCKLKCCLLLLNKLLEANSEDWNEKVVHDDVVDQREGHPHTQIVVLQIVVLVDDLKPVVISVQT